MTIDLRRGKEAVFVSEKVRISKRSVDAASARESVYRIWDFDLTGFGVKVMPSGTKTYIVHYRVGGGVAVRSASSRSAGMVF